MLSIWTYNALSLLCVSLGVLLLTLVALWGLCIVVVHILVRISREYYQKYGATIPEVVGAWIEVQQFLLFGRVPSLPRPSTLFLVIEEDAEKNS